MHALGREFSKMGEMQSARPVEAMRPNIWPKVDLSSVRHRRDNHKH
ncbi:protein of unassigned function [Methylobacterium oryzae CBMB20]|uniref:Protein of unassigned function n=1 Tax=Methylobacterium oryzae CBMB20 TaxID=693986 RepID=A0A089Q0G7_9HYPH|nr:protein of unassigned function [Methylobacterium oryzae CBMB20]